MAGEVVNLRLARKAKARAEAERVAEANRRLHGRTKAEKAREALEREQKRKLLDGAKRETDPDQP